MAKDGTRKGRFIRKLAQGEIVEDPLLMGEQPPWIREGDPVE
jgi:hypothetical protein